jgi:hypothetical protein
MPRRPPTDPAGPTGRLATWAADCAAHTGRELAARLSPSKSIADEAATRSRSRSPHTKEVPQCRRVSTRPPLSC